MKTVRNLFFLFTITVFACASTVLSIYNYNPGQSELKVFINFYASLAVSLTGIIALIIHYTKTRIRKTETGSPPLITSIRQAGLVSLGLVALLILQGLRILDLLSGTSILVVAILVELFFRTKKMHTSK